MASEDKKKKAASGVIKAATIMVVANAASSILGYVRNILISSKFGMGIESDAYYAAFTIPDLLYSILVGGGLSSAFIPVFSAYINEKREKEGYKMASIIFNIVMVVVSFFCVIGIIFAPQILPLIVQFDKGGPEFFHLTVKLTRIMFFQCFFMCLTGICMGILQAYKDFAPPSLGAVFYNVAIIVVGLVLLQMGFGITGFSIGVVVGAIVNFAIQINPIRKKGFIYSPGIDLRHEGVRKFFRLFWPMLLGVSVSQLNLIVNRYFGSGEGESVLSSMQNAQSIMQLPINIFGWSVALSVFPTMVEHYGGGDVDSYKADISMGVRNVVFLTLPATAGIIAMRVPLIRAMYSQGEFDPEHVPMLATLLMFYSIGIVGYSVRGVLLQGFYAVQETVTPVKINIFILLLNTVLCYILVYFAGANGLGMAYSAAGFASMCLLAFFLHRKVGQIRGREILFSCFKMLIASAIMAATIMCLIPILENIFPVERKLNQLIEIMILFGAGIVSYLVMAIVLRMKELTVVLETFGRKFGRKKG